MLLYLILLGTGLVAGILGGLLGIGGCIIMLPVLIFLLGYATPVAIGTTVTAVVITATSGAIGHLLRRNVDKKTAAVVAISGTLGAVVGSLIFDIAASIRGLLDIIIGCAFLFASLRMLYEGAKRELPKGVPDRVPGTIAAKSAIGFVIGIITGLTGLGGGYALVPAFIYLLRAGVKIAVGTSLASFITIALTSSLFKIQEGYVDVIAAILLGVGTAVGAQIGAWLVPRVPSWLIKLLFGIVFTLVAIKFILSGIAGLSG